MNEINFVQSLKLNNINITDEQLILFNHYYEFLIEYNKMFNLTAITEKEEVYNKHFYDSLTLLMKAPLNNNSSLCDVGAGAGFPSIPLKIIRPDLHITIIDSLGKRITFLNTVIKELKLTNIEALNFRAEDYAEIKRESFDYVTARAVARLNILAELCIPLVKINGNFIAMKGASGEEEIREAENSVKVLGCSLKNSFNFSLPFDGGVRNIIVYTKNTKTPDKYPRNYSQIKNKPL